MRAAWLLLLALLCASVARGQAAAGVDPADLEAPPPCAWWEHPATLRVGISAAPLGVWASWWCPVDAYSPWAHVVAAARFDLLPADKPAQIESQVWARDLPGLLAQRDRSVWHFELLDVWTPSIPAMWAARPPAPAWVVGKNGTSTTRPAYPIASGVRGKSSTSRATVGATCDCAVRSVEGASSYCAINQARTEVALCVAL